MGGHRLLSQNIFNAQSSISSQNLSKIQPISVTKYFSTESADPVQEKIDGFVKNAKVVVFMKGVPSAPQCGFSNAVVQILRMHDVTFESHNVLADEDIRQGINTVTGQQFHRFILMVNLSA